MSLGTGGPSQFGQNTSLGNEGRRKLIRSAMDLGVNLFDTAGQYGQSEQMLGDALRGISRDSYFLATKWKQYDTERNLLLEPSDLRLSVETSLDRLKTDCIDLLQFHGVLPEHYTHVVERLYPTMENLKVQGKIRFIGFTEVLFEDPKHEVVRMALSSDPGLWDTVMLKYGILNQWASKEILPLAEKHEIGVLNMAPVRLTLTRPEKLRTFFEEWTTRPSNDGLDLSRDNPLEWLVHGEVDSLTTAGYRFSATHQAISTVISGTSNIEHLYQNAAALEVPQLPARDNERLTKIFGDSASRD